MEKLEKVIDIIFIIGIVVVSIIFIATILELIDFRNDYKCATTTDKEWYIEHNCMRYESEVN